ncbi:MAG: redoxin family protein [Elusimicrobia bacterium]|nr:redoxin family protein [Elusimicrobiota bacterium]
MRTLLLALCLASPAAAMRPITPPGPEFPAGAAWVNAKPLSLSMFRDRKVVLVVFLNPTGLHSIRLLPTLEAWFDRYALRQLMVIGVISPDLEVQKDAVWGRAQIKRMGIDFPVILDNDRKLWKAYANDGWPTLYLLDRKGNICFDHLGEGSYAEFEGEIRDALYDLTTDPLPPPVNAPEPQRINCGHATPDIDMGARNRSRILKVETDPAKKLLLVSSREGELSLLGKWDTEPDGMRLAQANDDSGAFVRIIYAAPQVTAVLAPAAGKKTKFYIKRDEQWLYEGVAGRDIRYDEDGRSFVLADDERLYDLARDSSDKPHELDVIPATRGGGIYGFSFADACTVTQLP